MTYYVHMPHKMLYDYYMHMPHKMLYIPLILLHNSLYYSR